MQDFVRAFGILIIFTCNCAGKRGPCKVVNPSTSNINMWEKLTTADEDLFTELDIIYRHRNLTWFDGAAGSSAEDWPPLLEGDIIPSSSTVLLYDLGLPWPNATVPFLFHNMMSYAGRLQVLRAMNEYHKHTCIRFRKWAGEKDYLVIGSTYPYICASSVGRQGGAQLLHLGPYCTRSVGTPMHELMHALGFFHEHMRPDRDRYVHINYSNIDQGFWKNFREVNPGLSVNELGAGYDFGSLMHYRLCAMTNNSFPTIVPKMTPRARKVGQRKGFSKRDIIKLNNFYNCSLNRRSTEILPEIFVKEDEPNPPNKAAKANKLFYLFIVTITSTDYNEYKLCVNYKWFTSLLLWILSHHIMDITFISLQNTTVYFSSTLRSRKAPSQGCSPGLS